MNSLDEIDPFDSSCNTQGWDICIECRDDAYFPTPAHLRHAEEHIAKLDAAWLNRTSTRVASPPPRVASPQPMSPSSNRSPSPSSPTLLGLGNLHVHNGSTIRGSSRDTTVRSRSASPVFGEKRSSSQIATPRCPSTPSLQPRPPPNPSSIIHLAFPSSPSSNPHTTTQILNMLAFLSRYADPQNYTHVPQNGNVSASKRRGSLSATLSSSSLSSSSYYQPQPPVLYSRPLKILLHSIDGYTETSVLGLSYIMRNKRYSLPEAYLELQIERSRSFFVCSGDLGVLRRVESSLSSADNERRREEIVARREKERVAAVAAEVRNAQAEGHVIATRNPKVTGGTPNLSTNGDSIVPEQSNDTTGAAVVATSSIPSGSPNVNGTATGSNATANRWGKWGPSSWKSGSLSLVTPVFGVGLSSMASAAAGALADPISQFGPSSAPTGSVPSTPAANSSKPLPAPGRARALTTPISMPSRVDHNAWFTDPRFEGSFPSRVLPFLYLGNL